MYYSGTHFYTCQSLSGVLLFAGAGVDLIGKCMSGHGNKPEIRTKMHLERPEQMLKIVLFLNFYELVILQLSAALFLVHLGPK